MFRFSLERWAHFNRKCWEDNLYTHLPDENSNTQYLWAFTGIGMALATTEPRHFSSDGFHSCLRLLFPRAEGCWSKLLSLSPQGPNHACKLTAAKTKYPSLFWQRHIRRAAGSVSPRRSSLYFRVLHLFWCGCLKIWLFCVLQDGRPSKINGEIQSPKMLEMIMSWRLRPPYKRAQDWRDNSPVLTFLLCEDTVSLEASATRHHRGSREQSSCC